MDGVFDVLQGRRLPPAPLHTKQHPKEPSSRCSVRSLVNYTSNFLLRVRVMLLVLMATLGPPGFYVSLNLLLYPGLATFKAHLEPSVCVVASRSVLEGSSNCSWSSCRQGCTNNDLYRCWQVLVHHKSDKNLTMNTKMALENTVNATSPSQSGQQFINVTLNEVTSLGAEELREVLINSSDDDEHKLYSRYSEINQTNLEGMLVNSSWSFSELIRLQINVKGCGYDPCDAWWRSYSNLGTTFVCYVSADGSLTVPYVDYKLAATQVVLGVTPLVLSLGAAVVLSRLYCRCKGSARTDPTAIILQSSINPNERRRKGTHTQLILQKAMEQKHSGQHMLPSKSGTILKKTTAVNNKIVPSKRLSDILYSRAGRVMIM